MNNDLISREALKEAISSSIAEATEAGMVVNADYLWELLNYAIDNAPTIPLPDFKEGYKQAIIDGKTNFSRPQGEWARHDEWRGGEYIGGFYHVNCPCEDGYYSKWRTNFCPNCGAPMQKGGAE